MIESEITVLFRIRMFLLPFQNIYMKGNKMRNLGLGLGLKKYRNMRIK